MDERPTLLLSIDFEDWHQLVRRRVGAANWEQPGPALAGQTETLLALLDELRLKATFFILGMAARSHPQLVQAVAEKGHEIACHGDAHLPVYAQTPEEFAADLQAACGTIEQLTGVRPRGYRAPAFSIADWAYQVLADQGFAYDASQLLAGRGAPTASLHEFPVALWRSPLRTIPVGGASYWAMLPRRLVLHGLTQAGPLAGLYLHPQELDPKPLRAGVQGAPAIQRAHAAFRTVQRNSARRRAPAMLRAIAERFRLIPYGEAYASLSAGARPQPVQR
jgi:peptidoglycan/xylan/chitin deacetylase (PgdA/CDA1 family)